MNSAPSWPDLGWQAEQQERHPALQQIRLSSGLGSRLISKDKLGRLQGTPAQVNINRANTRLCGSGGQAGRNLENAFTPQSKFPFLDKELRARRCQLPAAGITCSPRHPALVLPLSPEAEKPRSDLLPGFQLAPGYLNLLLGSPAPPPTLQLRPTRSPVTSYERAKFTRTAQKEHVSPKIASQLAAGCLVPQLVLSWVKFEPAPAKACPASPTDAAWESRKVTTQNISGPLLALLIAGGFMKSA